jgi:hypothetical protein
MDTMLDIVKGRVRTVSALTLPARAHSNAEHQTTNPWSTGDDVAVVNRLFRQKIVLANPGT